MRRFWVYGISFLMTALAIGGTLFFFTKNPSQDNSLQASSTQSAANPQNAAALPPGPIEDRVGMAKQLKASGDFIKAQQIFKELIQSPQPGPWIEDVKKEYWDNNIKLLFSNQQVAGWTEEVTVAKGDSLVAIAKHFSTTPELIAESNHLSNQTIRPGQTLRVFKGQIALLASKSSNTMELKINGEVIKVYKVGTGVGGCTPVGDLKIINKIANPPWHHEGKVIPFGDPQNILGTRWMGFDKKGYGVHGTWDPSSTGKQSSAGCIRLANEDVEELFKVVPVGTIVTIVE